MKKVLALFITFLILILSIMLTRSAGLIQSAGRNALPLPQQGTLTLLQDTPEHLLDSFYADLLLKDYGTTMASLFYQREHYTPMVTVAFNLKVIGYKDHPVYTRQAMTVSDYALYKVSYTLMFKDINEPVPFLDVLPLIKQNGKWYIFIENPAATPLEEAVKELYSDSSYTQAEADHALQLQTLLTKYPDLAATLA